MYSPGERETGPQGHGSACAACSTEKQIFTSGVCSSQELCVAHALVSRTQSAM